MGGVAARRLAVSVVLALMPVAAGALSGPVRAQTTRVAVGDNFYDPEPVFIAPGTTLVWTNQGREAHTVTSDEGSPEQFDSRTLAPGGSYSHTFNQSGVFTYHCVFHEDMLGTIVVGQPSTDTPTASPPPPTATPTATQLPTHRGRKTVLATAVGVTYRFSPSTIHVTVGTKVTWENATSARHTVTSRTRGWKLDRTLKVHGTQAFVFKRRGTYAYYCRLHPGMVGKIVVQ